MKTVFSLIYLENCASRTFAADGQRHLWKMTTIPRVDRFYFFVLVTMKNVQSKGYSALCLFNLSFFFAESLLKVLNIFRKWKTFSHSMSTHLTNSLFSPTEITMITNMSPITLGFLLLFTNRIAIGNETMSISWLCMFRVLQLRYWAFFSLFFPTHYQHCPCLIE